MLFKGSQFLSVLASEHRIREFKRKLNLLLKITERNLKRKIMQVRGDIMEFDAQNFYEQDFSCKLILTRSLRRMPIT